MELTNGMKIGIGVAIAGVGGFAIYKIITSAKSTTPLKKVSTSTTSTSSGSLGTSAFSLPSVLNGTWLNTYSTNSSVPSSGAFSGTETAVISISADGTSGTYTIQGTTPIVRQMSNLVINAANNTVSFTPINADGTTAPIVNLTYNPTTNTFTGTQGTSLNLVWTSVPAKTSFIGSWY